MCAHPAKFVSLLGLGSQEKRFVSPLNPWNPCPPGAGGHSVLREIERKIKYRGGGRMGWREEQYHLTAIHFLYHQTFKPLSFWSQCSIWMIGFMRNCVNTKCVCVCGGVLKKRQPEFCWWILNGI